MPEKERESNDSSSDESYSDEATPEQKPETVHKEIKTASEYILWLKDLFREETTQ